MRYAACLALVIITGMGYAFAAGRQAALQPCLAARIDTLLVRSDSLVRVLRDARLK